jgi:phosphoribosylformylglycinamidine synthase subunit PurL
MAELYEELGLTTAEYQKIIEILGREPNKVELGMYSLMWSEHCSYKSSRKLLKLLPTRSPAVLQGPGENAGVVDIGSGYAVAFKMESHNHPSAVEPYQGAATGIGGIVRDIFTMGARPILCVDPLRFGDPANPRTRYLVKGVVAGIAGYGNCLGIPTVAGDLYFNPSYEGNPLINVMCLGLMRVSDLIKGVATGEGNAVILFGNRTGRDGIGGASVLASQEFDETSESKRPSVQVGDPFTEKLLIEACLELRASDLLVGLQDLGAAGLSCACCETASRGSVGMRVHIDRVPLREADMEPFEIMISESQERMLAIAEPDKVEQVLAVCERWGLNAVVLGEVVEGGMLEGWWHGEKVFDLPADSLASQGPVYTREASRPAYLDEVAKLDWAALEHPSDMNGLLERLVTGPNLCSRRFIYEQYDHMVHVNTVIYPGSDAAVIRIKDTSKALAVTCDGNGRYVYLDPWRGTQIALAEACRNITASGGVPLAMTNCLNFGNPEKPEIFWQFTESVKAMAEAARHFEVPVVSGNVSFYNETSGEAIHPTPVMGVIGLIGTITNRRDVGFPADGLNVLLLGETGEDMGGSEYLFCVHGITAGEAPRLDLALEKRVQTTCTEGIRRDLIGSAHDCSEGGVAVALLECCLAGKRGAALKVDTSLEPLVWLFSESQSRFIITVPDDKLEMMETLARKKDIPYTVLGKTGGARLKVNDWLDIGLEGIGARWEQALQELLS